MPVTAYQQHCATSQAPIIFPVLSSIKLFCWPWKSDQSPFLYCFPLTPTSHKHFIVTLFSHQNCYIIFHSAKHAACFLFNLVDLHRHQNAETDSKTAVLDRTLLKSIVMKWYWICCVRCDVNYNPSLDRCDCLFMCIVMYCGVNIPLLICFF